jgi:ammonia channel protein AmtB
MLPSAVLEAWENCSKTDTLFILVCTVFCWPIIPAVGLGYSGYSTRRSGLASFIPSILAVAVCSIQWFIVGYALAYGEGGGVFGDLKYAFHRGVLSEPVGTIPAVLFSEFQLVFEATVCVIAIGGACERGRIVSLIPFVVVSRFLTRHLPGYYNKILAPALGISREDGYNSR